MCCRILYKLVLNWTLIIPPVGAYKIKQGVSPCEGKQAANHRQILACESTGPHGFSVLGNSLESLVSRPDSEQLHVASERTNFTNMN